MTPWKNLSDIVKEVRFMTNDKLHKIKDPTEMNAMVESGKAFYSKYCFIFKPNISAVDMMMVKLKPNLAIDETELRFEDLALVSGRHIVEQSLHQEGRRIVTAYSQQNTLLSMYSVEAEQEVRLLFAELYSYF